MDVLDREYDWFLGEEVGEPGAKGLMKPVAKSLRLELFHRGPTEQRNEVRIGRVLDPPQEPAYGAYAWSASYEKQRS